MCRKIYSLLWKIDQEHKRWKVNLCLLTLSGHVRIITLSFTANLHQMEMKFWMSVVEISQLIVIYIPLALILPIIDWHCHIYFRIIGRSKQVVSLRDAETGHDQLMMMCSCAAATFVEWILSSYLNIFQLLGEYCIHIWIYSNCWILH